jgi:hypothetical protein
MDESRGVTQQATAARIVRGPTASVPFHLFRPGHLAGCARLSFTIDGKDALRTS